MRTNNMKTVTNIIHLVITVFAFGSFALSPIARAVTPAPDGGYPGGNTAEGQSALLSLTTGGFNTAVGWLSLRSNTDGQLNTAMGAGALLANTAAANTAIGAGALLSNTIGGANTANGAFGLFSNTTGINNTAIGFGALYNNMDGSRNTAIGYTALFSHMTGDSNNAVGGEALYADTQGVSNNAFGDSALTSNTTGENNTAIGDSALYSNTDGSSNTAVGHNALRSTTSNTNTAIGTSALENNTTGFGNIALGPGAGSSVTTAANVICIGSPGNNVDNSCFIGNIFGATSANGVAVLINSNGRLGTMTSSARFKDHIKPIGDASEALFALKPVSFRYHKDIDPRAIRQFGLVAEQVEKVNPDLVVRDENGKPYSVRYDQVNSMLLNEFLKEHKTVQELKATVQRQGSLMIQQQARMDAMAVALQKVSAEIQMSEPAPQVARVP
jgi:Chaperone of endosialidase